jgi:DNA-binding Xre family transcriptional regulator
MSEDYLINLGRIIEVKAKAKYSSNLEFAYACDINEKSIRRIFKGEQNISLKTLRKICFALNVKMSEILSETGN